MTRSGAPCPVGGMNRLAPQHASEKISIRKPNAAGAPPLWAAIAPAILNRIRKIRACLRKLSLNAAKNCVQNSGAKRRVVSKDVDIRLHSPLGGPSYRYGLEVTFIFTHNCGRNARRPDDAR